MAQNTENIEARLCDYIEGQLDDAGRAEIERHLDANPSHRTLLRELMQTRDLVRDLPREAAPAEVNESLQSQLERSVLLESDDQDQSDLVLHVRRLPQFAAIAAMLILAVGLAAVIYFILPQGGANQPEFTAAQSPIEEAPLTDEIPLPDDAFAMTDPMADAPAVTPPPAVLRQPQTEIASAMPTPGGTDRFTLAEQVPLTLPRSSSNLIAEIREFFGIGGTPAVAIAPQTLPENCLFVVVTTPDPIAANNDVTHFLISNRMNWQAAAEPMPEPVEQRVQQVLAGRSQKTGVALKDERARSDSVQKTAQSAELGPAAQADTAPDKGRMSTAVMPPAERVSGAGGDVLSSNSAPDRDQRLGDQIALPPDAISHFSLKSNPPRSAPAGREREQVIVARMTKRQAAELSNNLSNQRAGQSAEMIEEIAVVNGMAAAIERFTNEMTLTGIPRPFELAGISPPLRPTTAPAPSATTQPAVLEQDASIAPTVALGPTTQPLTVAAPVDEAIDVVILVQNAAAIEDLYAPATQPVIREDDSPQSP